MTERDALAIARQLRDLLRDEAPAGLRRYLDTGYFDAPAICEECLRAIATQRLSTDHRRWAAWLTVLAAHSPPTNGRYLTVPADGDALDAFLGLPDTDPTSDAVLDQFTSAYRGSYADADAVLDALTDIRAWQHATSRRAGKVPIGEFVSIDRDAIVARVLRDWQIVDRHGRLHVFARQPASPEAHG